MKNVDISFEVISKNCDEVTIEGYTTLEDLDNDERPLEFLDSNGNLQWNVPSNPYPEDRQYDKHLDYEILTNEFQSDDLLLQYLADYANETATIDRGEYILKINAWEGKMKWNLLLICLWKWTMKCM